MSGITDSDALGIKRAAAQSAGPAAKECAAMHAFLGAIDELIEFAGEDAIHAGSAIPGGRGCYGPDVAGMEAHIADVIEAARRAFAPSAPTITEKPAQRGNGLLTVHNADRAPFIGRGY